MRILYFNRALLFEKPLIWQVFFTQFSISNAAAKFSKGSLDFVYI